jgi:hypothetical protein
VNPGLWPQIQQALKAQQQAARSTSTQAPATEDLRSSVERDILALVEVVESHRDRSGELPVDADALYGAWLAAHPGQEELVDPYDGQRYGYELRGSESVIWSGGPDPEDSTDDLYYSSARAAAPPAPKPSVGSTTSRSSRRIP